MMDMYKIKLRYGGYFRLCKNSTTKRYCFGFQKCIHINKYIHYYDDLIEEVATHYPKDRGFVFSLWHIDIFDTKQSYIKVDSSENFQLMLDMYEVERELTVYVMTSDNVETSSMHKRAWGDVDDEQHDEEESEYSLSDDSDHSHYITDHEAEDEDFGPNYIREPHSCTRCYKDANKVVTQGWIASVVKDMVRSDGNVSAIELQKWVKKKYNIDVPYIKVYRGKEQAYNDMHGKWEDSFMKTNAFKEELLRRNLGSIVEVDFESKGNKWEDSFMKTNAFKEELPSMNDCEVRYKPVLDLLDSIREKIMVRLDNKRRIWASMKFAEVVKIAEVKYKDKRWEVSLDERECSCRRWQVNGIPSYGLQVSPMPIKDQWVNGDNEEKIYPPVIK
ncbi:hypothetical protein E3N88_26112 [Mikania micrantha]|uniref:SWIM-type domain-containing protein n=1 Tax=Mikania micrantha TaxID=192012 RepID=A0A5N6N8E7_9ASTR|nr:hypothetical protein E3N88_26112 [Mikania micrantha]